MKKFLIYSILFFSVCLLLMSLMTEFVVSGSHSENNLMSSAQTSKKQKAKISSVSMKEISLKPGEDEVVFTISGKNLHLIRSFRVELNSQPIPRGKIRLRYAGRATPSSVKIAIKAAADAISGEDYTLIVRTRDRDLRVPIKVKVTPFKKFTPKKEVEEGRIIPAKTEMRKISTPDFNRIVSKVFSNAKFSGNSCQSWLTPKRIYLDLPGVYKNSDDISSLQYELPENEKEKTGYGLPIWPFNFQYRVFKISVCLQKVNTLPWKGSIEGGKFKIINSFAKVFTFKTKAIFQYYSESRKKWIDRWDWSSDLADAYLEDLTVELKCEEFLTPQVKDGKLSYGEPACRGDVKMKWGESCAYDPYYVALDPYYKINHDKIFSPFIQDKIKHYANSVCRIMESNFDLLFKDGNVNNRFTKELTYFIKSGLIPDLEVVEIRSLKSTDSTLEIKLAKLAR